MKLPILLKLIGILIILVIVSGFIFEKSYKYPSQIKFGVTFSPRYARYLKLDWQSTYLQVLDELKVKNLRIPSYWNSLEPAEAKYDFADTDFMLSEAAKRGARAILVLGIRQPRWPECHIPNWAKKLTVKQRQQASLDFTKEIIKRYKDNVSIWAWQLENEPLMSYFGQECDPYDADFLKAELNLVKSLDNKPIILTDSGELGDWVIPIRLSDILGISVYRTTYNSFLGYKTYPLTPSLYKLKELLVKRLAGQPSQQTIITELQTEPWLSDDDADASFQRQHQLFSEDKLKENIEFAKKTGFDEVYLWGVEWWYAMDKQGYPGYLDYAKALFR